MALTAPYGIREGGRKLGSKKDTVWEISEEMLVVFFCFFLICLCNDIIMVIFFWYDHIEDVDNINLEILPIFLIPVVMNTYRPSVYIHYQVSS